MNMLCYDFTAGLENVLRKSHTIKEQKLEISDKLKPTTRAKPVPKKRTSLSASKREEVYYNQLKLFKQLNPNLDFGYTVEPR